MHGARRERRALIDLLGCGARRGQLPVGARPERVGERVQGERDVGHDRVAHRRPGRLVGVARDRDQLRARGQEIAGDVRVVGEHRRAHDEDQVVPLERLRERCDRGRQHALKGGMVLGKADPASARRRRRPHRHPLALGDLDRGIPRAARVDVRSRHEGRPARRLQPLRERRDVARRGRRAPAERPRGLACKVLRLELRAPVVHRDRHERRPHRRQRRVVDRLCERERDILGPRRLEARLHEWPRHLGRVAVGERRPHRDQRARLLARGDEQRRAVGARVEDRSDRVAEAGRGVEVHVRDPSARLRVPVGHADGDHLVQAEHVAKVVWEVREHRQLGRAGVAEDRRHPVRAEQVERRFAHRRHVDPPVGDGLTRYM